MQIFNIQFPKIGRHKLLSVWQKGKQNKGLRFLLERLSDNVKILVWIEEKDFPMAGGYQLKYTEDLKSNHFKTSQHIKVRGYNYYPYVSSKSNEELFQELLDTWLNPNSFFPENLNSYCHVPMIKINYQPVIKEL